MVAALRNPELRGPDRSAYRGDLQMHSDWSDGADTLAALAAGCEARGYDYCAVTDHSHGLPIAGGVPMTDIARQHRATDRVNAARAGNVTLANAIGNGVADDKLIYTYVPDLIRYYLHEEPLIDNVETYRLDDPDVLHDVLDRLDELVLKPVEGSGGKGIVIGPKADEQTLASLREAVSADPRGWIAQRPVLLSTSPTLVGDRVAPRHIDLRPFAVNDGDDVWLLPGGLTRVALPEGALVVNSSQGGGSKDTWVLATEAPAPAVVPAVAPVAVPAAPDFRDLGPAGAAIAAQQQQQQQERTC